MGCSGMGAGASLHKICAVSARSIPTRFFSSPEPAPTFRLADELFDRTSHNRTVGVRHDADSGDRVRARHQRRQLLGGNHLNDLIQTTVFLFEWVVSRQNRRDLVKLVSSRWRNEQGGQCGGDSR